MRKGCSKLHCEATYIESGILEAEGECWEEKSSLCLHHQTLPSLLLASLLLMNHLKVKQAHSSLIQLLNGLKQFVHIIKYIGTYNTEYSSQTSADIAWV